MPTDRTNVPDDGHAAVPSGIRSAVTVGVLVATVGIGYRLHELGRYAFWNDEAWVAVSTRVDSVAQYLLVVACSPALWTLLLQPLALLPHPELSLRLLPFAFSVATLWLAWRLGGRLAAHPLGGVLAVALVALDPTSIQYAKQLKQYSAEAFLMLAALLLAVDVAHDGRHLRWLVLVLLVALVVSNAQLLATPPVLAALLVVATFDGNRMLMRRLLVASAIVGVCDLAFYVLVVRAWNTEALQAFWTVYYLSDASLGAASSKAYRSLQAVVSPGLGPYGTWITLAAVVIMLATRIGRVPALAIVLLVIELVVLARWRLVPFGVPRISLFYTTAILVFTGAALARLVVSVARRPGFRPVAAAVLAAVVTLIVLDRPWTRMAAVEAPEDVGRLIRRLETHRHPDDRVLLYHKTVYVYAYYQTRRPLLLPFPPAGVGFYPLIDDPAVTIITAPSLPRVLDGAIAGARRVWFVGSRFRGHDTTAIATALAARGTIDLRRHGQNALLLRLTPRPRAASGG